MTVVSFSRLGAHYKNGNKGQVIGVEKIINHESFHNPFRYAHDISLLKLSRPAVLARDVNLACLPVSHGSVAVGKHCWVTGRLKRRLLVPCYCGRFLRVVSVCKHH